MSRVCQWFIPVSPPTLIPRVFLSGPLTLWVLSRLGLLLFSFHLRSAYLDELSNSQKTSHTHHFFFIKIIWTFLLTCFFVIFIRSAIYLTGPNIALRAREEENHNILPLTLYFWTMYETIKQAQIQHFLGVQIKSHRQTNIYRIYISCPFVCLSIWHCAAACGKW